MKKAAFACAVLLLLVLLYGGSYLALTTTQTTNWSMYDGATIDNGKDYKWRVMRVRLPVWFWKPAAAVEGWITNTNVAIGEELKLSH